MKRINHPEFFDGDLPRIEKELGSEEQLVEFLHCFDKAILEIEVDPSGGASLERSLAVYRKKKFHSVRRPPQGTRADYRLIYRYEVTTDTLFVLGTGKRMPGQSDDVYAILNARTPI